MRHYFGTDGVRGVANKELSPELAFQLGRYGGAVLLRHAGESEEKPRVLVGRDPRISGPLLEHALVAGLLSIGMDVYQLGIVPTPAVAYLTKTTGATAGVMISASHNPVEDNGIKFFANDGFKLSDEQEMEIEALIAAETDDLPRPSAANLGTAHEYLEGISKYLEFLESTVPGDFAGLKIGIDAANGASAPIVNRLFADFNCEFVTMATQTDGLSINKGVGSTHLDALAKMVVEKGLDCGVAFDGDGDRCLAVDELGRTVDGDHIMLLLAKKMKECGKLADDTVVATVMSNLGFRHALKALDLKGVTTQVGDRYVVQEMRAKGYNLGGEQSGHIILFDHNTTGDGLLTAVQLLAILKESGQKFSELVDEIMTTYPQVLVNVQTTPTGKAQALKQAEVKAAIAKAEEELGADGRILVRPSGTEPLLRVMVEASTPEEAQEKATAIAQVIQDRFGA